MTTLVADPTWTVTLPPSLSGPVMAALSWPNKDPAETVDACLDLTAYLAAQAGENVVQVDAAVPFGDGALVVQHATFSGAQILVRLAGGTNGISYDVALLVTFAPSGRQRRFVLRQPVSTPAIATPAPSGVLTVNGQPLDWAGLLLPTSSAGNS